MRRSLRHGLGMTRLRNIMVRRNADGSLRLYHRKTLARLPDLPETHPDFLAAWAAEEAAARSGTRPRKPIDPERSLGALAVSYTASRGFRDLADGTRAYQVGHIARILGAKGGAARAAPVAGIRRHHVEADMASLTPSAAITRLKVWRAMLGHAREIGWIAEDPSASVRRPRYRSDGHHTWEPDEIAAFRARHPVGSEARIAFEVLYWTAARRSDAVRLGRQMIDREGFLTFTAQKNRVWVAIPVTAPLAESLAGMEDDRRILLECLEALPPRLTFIARRDGAGRSDKAFGNWMAARVAEAGLDPRCTAHGLRKARAARIAEVGGSESQVQAWIGDTTLAESVRYTKKADKRKILGGERRTNMGTSPRPRSAFGAQGTGDE